MVHKIHSYNFVEVEYSAVHCTTALLRKAEQLGPAFAQLFVLNIEVIVCVM